MKQRYQARAEEERQKYDVDMASYRQGTFERDAPAPREASSPQGQASPAPSPQQVFEVRGQAVTTQDYANLLQ